MYKLLNFKFSIVFLKNTSHKGISMIQHDMEWSAPNLWNTAKTRSFLNTVF